MSYKKTGQAIKRGRFFLTRFRRLRSFYYTCNRSHQRALVHDVVRYSHTIGSRLVTVTKVTARVTHSWEGGSDAFVVGDVAAPH